MNNKEIIISNKDQSLYCAVIQYNEWRKKIGELRYKEFVESLKWVKGDPNTKLELDDYDNNAVHIAVFSQSYSEKIISYARILKKDLEKGIMLESDAFRVLLNNDFIVPVSSIEVSRFCLEQSFRKTKIGYKANMYIFKSVLFFMKKNNYRHIFAIADGKDTREYSHKDYLLKLFSFQLVGIPYNFQEGVLTYAMALKVEDLEKDLIKYQHI